MLRLPRGPRGGGAPDPLKKRVYVRAMLETALATPPAFPASFYVGEQSQTVLNTGGYRKPEEPTAFCCAQHSPNCRIQTLAAGNDYFEDAKNNRTRQDSAQA